MSDDAPNGSRNSVPRLVPFLAAVAFGLAAGYATMHVLFSSVNPGTLGAFTILAAVAFVLAGTVTSAVVSLAVGFAANRLGCSLWRNPHPATSNGRRLVVLTVSLLGGGVLLVVVWWAFDRFGPLVVGLIAIGAVIPATIFAPFSVIDLWKTFTRRRPTTDDGQATTDPPADRRSAGRERWVSALSMTSFAFTTLSLYTTLLFGLSGHISQLTGVGPGTIGMLGFVVCVAFGGVAALLAGEAVGWIHRSLWPEHPDDAP